MTIFMHGSIILLLINMAIGQNWRIMSKVSFTDADVQAGIQDMTGYTQNVDALFGTGNLKLPPVSDFLTNVALKESYAGAGLDSTATHTLGPWQIDPIKMYDMQQRMTPGTSLYDSKFAARGQEINNWFAQQGYADFDIANLATVNRTQDAQGNWQYAYGDLSNSPYARDPQAHAYLARMGLTPYAEAVPDNMFGQGQYWDKYWNRNPNAGTAQEYVNMIQDHRSESNTDYYPSNAFQDATMYFNDVLLKNAFKKP